MDPGPGVYSGGESSFFQVGPPALRKNLGVCPRASADLEWVAKCLIGSFCIRRASVPACTWQWSSKRVSFATRTSSLLPLLPDRSF